MKESMMKKGQHVALQDLWVSIDDDKKMYFRRGDVVYANGTLNGICYKQDGDMPNAPEDAFIVTETAHGKFAVPNSCISDCIPNDVNIIDDDLSIWVIDYQIGVGIDANVDLRKVGDHEVTDELIKRSVPLQKLTKPDFGKEQIRKYARSIVFQEENEEWSVLVHE